MTKKPTLELNPVAEEAAAPKSDNVITDAKGRTLKIEPPDVLTESRLIRALGQDASMNAAYMGAYVLPAVSVVEIDGEEMPFPTTQREVDAAIKRLGREGINAVVMHMAGQGEAQTEAAEAIKN